MTAGQTEEKAAGRMLTVAFRTCALALVLLATLRTVPLNWTVQQLLKLGKQPIALQFGARYYAEKPNGGSDWGLRSRRPSCSRNESRGS